MDSGATKSFISHAFALILRRNIELLKEVMIVEVANRDKVSVNQIFPQCEVEILGHRFQADLIPFQLGEFDVILGMDWLSKYHANIDCKDQKVKLRTPVKKMVVFRGQKPTKKFLAIMQRGSCYDKAVRPTWLM